jgi:DNA-binding NarL/FixJ family response regulator
MVVSRILARKPTVVIADDYPPMCEKVAGLLSENFTIVGRVSDGEAAVRAALTLRPDVLILDVAMPGMDGIEAAKRIHEEDFHTKIIFLTAGVELGQMDCQKVGAHACVLKKRMYSDLVPAIEEALAGRAFLSGDSSQV